MHTYISLPPNYSFNYNFPPLGTPCLTAFLKQRGILVTQRDHNIAYLDFWLEKLGLDGYLAAVKHQPVKMLLNNLFAKKAKSDLYYASLLPRENDEHIPYQDNTNSSFYFTERLLTSEHLTRYLEDEVENTFLRFFQEKGIVEEILNGQYDLLGLSVISPAQVIPTLTLCNLIKRARRDFPIILGGPWPSLFRMELAKWGRLGAWVDGVIFDEGETPLYEYCKVLEGKQSIGEVPNLFFFDKEKVHWNRKRTEEEMDALPPPDFDGMPLDRYESNKGDGLLSVTYQTSRECYWNRCTYCVDLPFPKHTYREKNVDLAVQDIKALQAKYRAEELILSDLAMAPAYMRKLSRRLLEEKIQIRWWTFARLDGALNRELFDLAKKAGCYRISFGFESGNQRVCDFIDKGTKIPTMSRVIKDCGSAGIKITAQTMIGIPSETLEEALDTIQFLLEHFSSLDEVCYNTYYLTPGNYIYRDTQKHQVVIDEKNRPPFQFFLKFRHAKETGIDREQAKQLLQLFHQKWGALKQKKGSGEKTTPLTLLDGFKPRLKETPRCLPIKVGEEEAFLCTFGDPSQKDWQAYDEKMFSVVRRFNGSRSLKELAQEFARENGAAMEANLADLKAICQNLSLAPP